MGFVNAWMQRIGGEEEIRSVETDEGKIEDDITKDEGMAMASVSEEAPASVAVAEEEHLYVVVNAMNNIPQRGVIKAKNTPKGITCIFGTFPVTAVQGPLALGPGTEVGYNGALATVQGIKTYADGEWFEISQNGQQLTVQFKDLDIEKRNLAVRGPGQTEPYVHNTGMSNNMKIGILLFVVVILLSALAGMYLYFQEDDELDTDFVDLEAGLGPRRAPMPEKRERPNEQFHMSGKELKEAAKTAKPRRSRRKMKRSASRSRPEGRSRQERSRKSRRPRGSRRPRRQRSRLGPRVRVN